MFPLLKTLFERHIVIDTRDCVITNSGKGGLCGRVCTPQDCRHRHCRRAQGQLCFQLCSSPDDIAPMPLMGFAVLSLIGMSVGMAALRRIAPTLLLIVYLDVRPGLVV